jgi:hypothetical protein
VVFKVGLCWLGSVLLLWQPVDLYAFKKRTYESESAILRLTYESESAMLPGMCDLRVRVSYFEADLRVRVSYFGLTYESESAILGRPASQSQLFWM